MLTFGGLNLLLTASVGLSTAFAFALGIHMWHIVEAKLPTGEAVHDWFGKCDFSAASEVFVLLVPWS